MGADASPAFALWITGRPGAGKTTLANALLRRLHKRGIDAVVLSSDFFRRRFSPEAKKIPATPKPRRPVNMLRNELAVVVDLGVVPACVLIVSVDTPAALAESLEGEKLHVAPGEIVRRVAHSGSMPRRPRRPR